MQTQKTNINSLVEQCLVLNLSSPPLLEEEGTKPYFASASSGTLTSYPSFMDCHISQTLNHNHSTLIGDYIGMESCLDLASNMDFSNGDQGHKLLATTRRRREKTKREFPPPIPLLARTENLPSHMPWVLRRYYTDDGRLILREERVRHHEYFKAHRSGGRLTLQLVLMDDDFSFPPRCEDDSQIEEHLCGDDEVGEDGENVGSEEEEGIEENNEEGGKGDGIGEEEATSGGGASSFSSPSSSSSCLEGGSKCLSYIPVMGSSTCIFGVPVPALRPVHSWDYRVKVYRN